MKKDLEKAIDLIMEAANAVSDLTVQKLIVDFARSLKIDVKAQHPEAALIQALYFALTCRDLDPRDVVHCQDDLTECYKRFLGYLDKTSVDTAHLGPFTCVRACRHCGVLISGGPTACVHCVEMRRVREKAESTTQG